MIASCELTAGSPSRARAFVWFRCSFITSTKNNGLKPAMVTISFRTARLEIICRDADEARSFLRALEPHQLAEVSPQWVTRIEQATGSDPWLHGFTLLSRGNRQPVGSAGFKGAPDPEGMVEIAYAVEPEHQGKGYATETVEALVKWAFATGAVRVVRAHTLRERNASVRVLEKSGFRFCGEVVEPEDGLVWRWEKAGQSDRSRSIIDGQAATA